MPDTELMDGIATPVRIARPLLLCACRAPVLFPEGACDGGRRHDPPTSYVTDGVRDERT
jgi:hypothetical protein